LIVPAESMEAVTCAPSQKDALIDTHGNKVHTCVRQAVAVSHLAFEVGSYVQHSSMSLCKWKTTETPAKRTIQNPLRKMQTTDQPETTHRREISYSKYHVAVARTTSKVNEAIIMCMKAETRVAHSSCRTHCGSPRR